MSGKLTIFIDPKDPIRYEIQLDGKYMVSGLHYGLKEVGVISDTQCYVKYIENPSDHSPAFGRTRTYTLKSKYCMDHEDKYYPL